MREGDRSQSSALDEALATPTPRRSRVTTFDEELSKIAQEKQDLEKQLEDLQKVRLVEAACSADLDKEIAIEALKGLYDKIMIIDLTDEGPDRDDRPPCAVEWRGAEKWSEWLLRA
jgi:hypothetical protein